MTINPTKRRGVRRAGALAIIAGFLVALMGVMSSPASAASVEPTHPEGNNPTCQDVGYTYGFKINAAPTDGVYEVKESESGIPGGGSVTISNAGVNGGVYEFDWTSTIAWDAVLVKQASDAHNLYTYVPPSTGDTDLTPKLGQNQGGISHVNFCRNDAPPPPETCPDGTVWNDANQNQEVDEGECETPEEPTCPEGTTWVDANENELVDEGECETPEVPEVPETPEVEPEVLPNVVTPPADPPAEVKGIQVLPRTGTDTTTTMTLIGLGMVLLGVGAMLFGRPELAKD